MYKLFKGDYKGKRILVTGHTGFKGSWLALWLTKLGAEVLGYALNPPTNPSHYECLDLNVKSIIGDIRDKKLLESSLKEFNPEIVFHLAAQPLVRRSYLEPTQTFETNIMGTLNLYEVCRKCESVRAIVCITTDKVYENKEVDYGYNENDVLGGKDPYSASKAAVEIVTRAYRESFFNLEKFNKSHNTLLATARAGNVMGGGDWADDRLIPDIIKAAVANQTINIRNPNAIRPWQHVLEPLSGYLQLGSELLRGKADFAEAFNFGPEKIDEDKVIEVVKKFQKHWDKINYAVIGNKDDRHEANLLKLDCEKAKERLNWGPVWDIEKNINITINWYRNYYECNKILSLNDLDKYVNDAAEKNLPWTKV